jgi:hypothetical protein
MTRRTAGDLAAATTVKVNKSYNDTTTTKKKQKGLTAAVRLTSEKALLYMFFASAAIISISTLLITPHLPVQEDSFVTNSNNNNNNNNNNNSTVTRYHHRRHHHHDRHRHSITAQLKKQKHSEVVADSTTTTSKIYQKQDYVETNQSSMNNHGNSIHNNHDNNGNSNSTDLDYFQTHSSPFHVIFSSGCSTFQDWQSYVFFYHVLKSGQKGHVTRIASGCPTSTEEKTLQDIFAKEIQSMRPGYHHLHLTPDYSTIPKKFRNKFKYFNKPYGVRHWMEHALGYPNNHALHDDSIIILLDPDQILLRPFTGDFSNSSESSEAWRLHHEYGPKRISERPKFSRTVQHGSPFAQQYGYGLQWLDKVRPEYVFQGQRWPTPVSNLTRKEARDFYYAMGPPYVITAKDLWSIVTTWSDIVPRVHDEYPHLLAE